MTNDSISLELQPRDYSLLLGLFESRVMTAKQAGQLHFEGKHEYAKRRLRQLKTAGFIGTRARRVNEPAVLFLTRVGFSHLKTEGLLQGYPTLSSADFENRASVSNLTLQHELEIMDVKAAIVAAMRGSQRLKLAEFSTWPALHQFETSLPASAESVLVKPDGFIRIQERDAEGGEFDFEHAFFLELDRSSETQGTLLNKALCYRQFYRTGGFATRNGATAREFERFPFLVLIVMKSAERRNIIAERFAANNPAILSQVWLTTLAEVTSNPLGQIWITPADHRAVVSGTRFEKSSADGKGGYRRSAEREKFVETHIKKRALLES